MKLHSNLKLAYLCCSIMQNVVNTKTCVFCEHDAVTHAKNLWYNFDEWIVYENAGISNVHHSALNVIGFTLSYDYRVSCLNVTSLLVSNVVNPSGLNALGFTIKNMLVGVVIRIISAIGIYYHLQSSIKWTCPSQNHSVTILT